MKLTQNENELTIGEAPGCLWIFGLFFAIIGGAFVYGSLGGFSNYAEVGPWGLAASFFMGSTGVAAGFWIIFHAPVTKVTVDRKARTAVHTQRGLFGKKERSYRFDLVREFCLIEEVDGDGDPIWSLGLELSDGERVRISSLASPAESFKRDFVFQANQFMGRQMPSYRDPSKFKTSGQ
jgi:hypothetical protein